MLETGIYMVIIQSPKTDGMRDGHVEGVKSM